jgi:hypothetical protein
MNYTTFGLALAVCSIPALALTVLRYSKKGMSSGATIFLVIALCLIQLVAIIVMLPLGTPIWITGLVLCLYAPLSWGLGWQLYQRARFSR